MDAKSSTPLYVQIKDQIRMAVATGALGVGDQLPTVRDLSERVLLNPNTVARAYRELQIEGLLVSRQGSGTFVAAGAATIGQEEGRRRVAEELERLAATAASLGLTGRQFQRMAGQALDGVTDSQEVDDDVATGD